MKRFLVVLLVVMIMTTNMAYSESGTVIVDIPEFNVTVNGRTIDTIHSQYPVIRYKGITYFPMTYDYLNSIGLDLDFDAEDGLSIRVNSGKTGDLNESFLGANNVLGQRVNAQVAGFKITVNGKAINNNNEEYPVLLYKDITYFPMTWRFAVTEFGWETKWDDKTGFAIETRGYTFVNVNTSNEPTQTTTNTKKLSTTEIADLSDAVVKLIVYKDGIALSTGSGFYYNDQGTLVTNYHVIEEADSIEILRDDETYYEGGVQLIGYDIEEDIAIIDTDLVGNSFIPFGNSDTVKQGEKIYTIGSPLGLLNTLAEGLVSSVRDSIQISAAISPGSSGGVLLNEYGQAIGVTYAGFVEGENLGFAIPINKVLDVDTSKEMSIEDNTPEETSQYETIKFDNGDVYVGELKDGQFHGYGSYTWAEGDVYIGYWYNDNMDGFGSYTWVNGDKYEGNWKNDQKHGYGETTLVSGTTYKGEYKNDTWHGLGVYSQTDGYSYSGTFYNGKYDGFGVETFASGDQFQGMFYDDMWNGNGKYTFSDGSELSGSFLNDEYYSDDYNSITSPALEYTYLIDYPYATGYNKEYITASGYTLKQVSFEIESVLKYKPDVIIYRSGDDFRLLISGVDSILTVDLYK